MWQLGVMPRHNVRLTPSSVSHDNGGKLWRLRAANTADKPVAFNRRRNLVHDIRKLVRRIANNGNARHA